MWVGMGVGGEVPVSLRGWLLVEVGGGSEGRNLGRVQRRDWVSRM